MVEKVGFTNCVFEKLCFPENTIFIVFSAKHSFSKTKTVCWKNRKFMKNSGLFLNMAKWCFGGLFFWGFNVIVVCFWCVWHSSKSVKNACFFSQFWVFFSGVAHCCSSGFGRFRCFCVSCVCFSFLCCFCFCFVCFVLGFVVGCCCFVFFGCFFWLFFCGFLFFVVSFGGFKGQVRWPKGPPHLALNPPYFICFCVFCFFFVIFVFWLVFRFPCLCFW